MIVVTKNGEQKKIYEQDKSYFLRDGWKMVKETEIPVIKRGKKRSQEDEEKIED